jgi:hypothetical protein
MHKHMQCHPRLGLGLLFAMSGRQAPRQAGLRSFGGFTTSTT